MADIDEIEAGFALREAQRKVTELVETFQGTLTHQSLCESSQIGAHFGYNFNFIVEVYTLFEDRSPESICRFLSTLNALFDILLEELN